MMRVVVSNNFFIGLSLMLLSLTFIWRKNMRRTASEIIHDLEIRIARLERKAARHTRNEGLEVLYEVFNDIEAVFDVIIPNNFHDTEKDKEIMVKIPDEKYLIHQIKRNKLIYIEKEDGEGFWLKYHRSIMPL
jgi:hypothetical protein